MKKITLAVLFFASISVFAADHKISQKNKNFDIKNIEINVGDTITFTNDEKDITHNVYSLGPKNTFELKTQPPGKTSQVEFKDAGDTDVECAIHPGMKLKVKVKGK